MRITISRRISSLQENGFLSATVARATLTLLSRSLELTKLTNDVYNEAKQGAGPSHVPVHTGQLHLPWHLQDPVLASSSKPV